MLALLCLAGMAHAQYTHWTPYRDEFRNMKDIEPRGYVCYRTDTPVVVDGVLEEEAWKFIPWTEYFVDIEGEVKPRPWFRTQAKMTWDDTYFYVAADMQERDVWGTLTEHDSIIYHDNDFEIFIDPDSDNHEYYELEINALNTVWDLMLMIPYRDGGERINEWSVPGLKTSISVNGTLNDPSDRDQGWSVEFAIPWVVLREYAHKETPPAEGDRWRVNFSRVQYRCTVMDGAYAKEKGHPGENWVWSPPGVINMHCPEKWGYVMFTSERPGTVSFVHDATEPARMTLHEIYYAQRDHYRNHGRYARSMDELGLFLSPEENWVEPPSLSTTGGGYSATLTVSLPGGVRELTIDHQSHVTLK